LRAGAVAAVTMASFEKHRPHHLSVKKKSFGQKKNSASFLPFSKKILM
jgi:hypothetical protein